jgi:hypothetical protein
MLHLRRSVLLLSLVAAAAGCSSPPDDVADLSGTATLTLDVVPSAAQCIQINVAGARHVVKEFSLARGQSSATLALGELPTGPVAVSGQAYDVACKDVLSASPSWMADPRYATIHAGVARSLSLTFRRAPSADSSKS